MSWYSYLLFLDTISLLFVPIQFNFSILFHQLAFLNFPNIVKFYVHYVLISFINLIFNTYSPLF